MPLTPIEYLYYLPYKIVKRRSIKKQRELKGFTISVGNITLGGTGKTPLVIELVSKFSQKGLRVTVLTRGYKGDREEPIIVSRGRGPEVPWYKAGDEAYLIALKTKGAWVVKDKNRYRAGLISGERDVFILDDGFQHWKLKRDLDIVMIDATNPFSNGRLLPIGRLREPLEALERAHVVVVNKGKDQKIINTLRRCNCSGRIFYSDYEILGFSDPVGVVAPLDALKGKRIYLFSGIGNPTAMYERFLREELDIVGYSFFRDHISYRQRHPKKIQKRADELKSDIILTTEKDIVKLEGRFCKEHNIYSVPIRCVIEDSFFKYLLEEMAKKSCL